MPQHGCESSEELWSSPGGSRLVFGLRELVDAEAMKKRAYSSEFPTAPPTESYALHYIPLPLWRQVKAKAKRDGVSLRTLILRLLSEWVSK